MGVTKKLKTQLGENLHHIDYRMMRIKNPPETVTSLPKGVWVPISVAAHLLNCSGQTLRLMMFSNQLEAVKFPVGPTLVNIEKYMVEKP